MEPITVHEVGEMDAESAEAFLDAIAAEHAGPEPQVPEEPEPDDDQEDDDDYEG